MMILNGLLLFAGLYAFALAVLLVVLWFLPVKNPFKKD